jgi:hypothetical protein
MMAYRITRVPWPGATSLVQIPVPIPEPLDRDLIMGAYVKVSGTLLSGDLGAMNRAAIRDRIMDAGALGCVIDIHGERTDTSSESGPESETQDPVLTLVTILETTFSDPVIRHDATELIRRHFSKK